MWVNSHGMKLRDKESEKKNLFGRTILKITFIFIFYIAYTYICVPCACPTRKARRGRMSDPLELE